MKTRVCSLLGLTTVLAVFACQPAFAAAPSIPGYSHPVGSVEHCGNTLVARGSSKIDVRKSLGKPYHELSSDVWSYANFHGGHEQHPDDDCSILLVTFVEGRVIDLKLVNERAEKIVAALIRARSSEKAQVAAK